MMPALAMIGRDVDAELAEHHRHDDRDHDAGDDALEQAAHRLGALDAPAGAGGLSPGEGLVHALADGEAAGVTGEHAHLGSLHQPVDQAVEQPADDQPEEGQAEQGERLADEPVGARGELLVAGLGQDPLADGFAVGAGVGERKHGRQYGDSCAEPKPPGRRSAGRVGETTEAAARTGEQMPISCPS